MIGLLSRPKLFDANGATGWCGFAMNAVLAVMS
jgi:hypothetical protein